MNPVTVKVRRFALYDFRLTTEQPHKVGKVAGQ
jgi:hypothetical protein